MAGAPVVALAVLAVLVGLGGPAVGRHAVPSTAASMAVAALIELGLIAKA